VVTFLLGARASRLRRVYEGKMPLLPGACVTPDVNSYLALLRRRGPARIRPACADNAHDQAKTYLSKRKISLAARLPERYAPWTVAG